MFNELLKKLKELKEKLSKIFVVIKYLGFYQTFDIIRLISK